MLTLDALVINPEFRSLIPALSPEEYDQLERNILQDSIVHDPIIVWAGKNIVVDGHNRYSILKEHPEIPFSVFEKEFSGEDEVIIWICHNQIGRRNLTEAQKDDMIATAYQAQMRIMQNRTSGKFATDEKPGRTREKIADEFGIAPRSVDRANLFAKGLNEIEAVVPGTKEKILTGQLEVVKKDVMDIPHLPEEQKADAIKAVSEGKRIWHNNTSTGRATPIIHEEEYNYEDFQREMELKVEILKDSLNHSIREVHNDMARTKEGSDIIHDALLMMVEVIRGYLDAYCSTVAP